MQTERRVEEKRLDIHRPVEIVHKGENSEGYTQNLSDDGIRARFDTTMEPGANVLVRLSLVDGADPVEKTATVVWSAPDLYGEGIEVGLRLVDGMPVTESPSVEEHPTAPAETPVDPPDVVRLRTGQLVEIEAGGIGLEATVAHIGDLEDDGTIQVKLTLSDAPADTERERGEDDDLLDEEKWKPRPFRDAYRTVSRYAAPVLKVIGRVLMVLFSIVATASRWIWRKLPARFTYKVENLLARLALRRRIAHGVAIVTNTFRTLAARISGLRATGQTGGTGD